MEISHDPITKKMREAHHRSHNTEWNSFTLIQRLIMNWQKENEIFISVSRPQPIRFRSLLIPLSIFSSNSSWDNEIKFSCTLSRARHNGAQSRVIFLMSLLNHSLAIRRRLKMTIIKIIMREVIFLYFQLMK